MAKQLRDDLPQLIDAGIITPEIAQRIDGWYAQQTKPQTNWLAITLGVFATFLVSLGIILVIAHNWDELPKTAKIIIAFLPLVIGQLLCIYILLKKRENRLLSECAAIFLYFAIPACVALISQIYHIGGSTESFLLTWILLGFALIYIMRSSVVSLLHIAIITWYGILADYSSFGSGSTTYSHLYILLLLIPIPHYYLLWKKKGNAVMFHMHNWAITISVVIMLGSFASEDFPFYQWIMQAYLSLFCILYIIGKVSRLADKPIMANPFLLIGTMGIFTIFAIVSFEDPWHFDSYVDGSTKVAGFFSWYSSWVIVALLLINLCLFFLPSARKIRIDFNPLPFSAFLLAILLVLGVTPPIGQFVANVWILLLGLYYVRRGANEDHLGILNLGLVVLVALALLRFFDDSIPFIWRGLFFLATGGLLFFTNYWMLRRRKKLTKNVQS
ncbi:MAG: DUF2157 domain-containing protein [Chitinophagaceae bacterium]|nr:DUF2157 domain-containing protein [Chitinophagaceae bacterium]